MATNLLEVEDLKTHFFTRRGVVKAVDGVSFSLQEGETLGLVGESGCGKSATGLSILRLVPPPGKIVSGRILFRGENLLEKSNRDMRKIRGKLISEILQDPMTSLNPVFTIGSQLAEVLRIHQKMRGRALWHKVVEVLKLVNIPAPETRLRSYPHQMSGGMRQRVAGGMSIACQPKLLIADEATTALDATIQAQYLKLLKNMQQTFGVALIFITHDFGIVATMCDRVAVMYAGHIVEIASTRELFDHATHPYTSALLNCVPDVDKDTKDLMTIEGQPPSLLDPPPGCTFAPRCCDAKERCAENRPPLTTISDGHSARCWRVC